MRVLELVGCLSDTAAGWRASAAEGRDASWCGGCAQKKQQINFEIISLAKIVDAIEQHLRSAAQKIDAKVLPDLAALRANLTTVSARLTSEEAR